MKNLVLGVLVGVGLVGCATPQYNYIPEATQISKPPIGSEAMAYVGDQMLTQGKFIKRTALFLNDPIRVSFAYTLSAGYYPKTGEDVNGVYYGIGGIQNAGTVQKAAIADPYKAVMVTPDNKLCVITVFNAKNCIQVEKEKVVSQEVDSLTDNSFQQTLIYSGKVGNKINVGYREFSSNLARPAFNNDVEYDLNESKTIGYKGAMLEVIEATNQFIKYKVLKNFNLAQE